MGRCYKINKKKYGYQTENIGHSDLFCQAFIWTIGTYIVKYEVSVINHLPSSYVHRQEH